MKVFLKAQLSSILATLVDFTITIALVELGRINYALAVIAGAVGGAFANFVINRYWSFGSVARPVMQQTLRYALVWTGSVLLNVSGIYLLTHFLGVQYLVSKILVSVTVGLTFNYFLQKEYVFSTHEKAGY